MSKDTSILKRMRVSAFRATISWKLIAVFFTLITIFSLSLLYTFKLLDNINNNHKNLVHEGITVLAQAKNISDDIVSHGFSLRQIIQNNITQYNHDPAQDISELNAHLKDFQHNIERLRASYFMDKGDKETVTHIFEFMRDNFDEINQLLFTKIPTFRKEIDRHQKNAERSIAKSRIMLKTYLLKADHKNNYVDEALILKNLVIIENNMRSFEYNFSKDEVIHARHNYTQAIENITKYLIECRNEKICQYIALHAEQLLQHVSHKEGYFYNLLQVYDALEKANNLAIEAEQKTIAVNKYIAIAIDNIRHNLQNKIKHSENAIHSGKIFVLAAVIIIFIASVAVVFLYIIPFIIRRLTKLTQQTYCISNGQLDIDIDVQGHDEIADMSKALEHFRQELIKKKEIEDEREKLVENLLSSNQQLERFAYICSHDLQEPARMVRAFSQKIKETYHDIIISDPKLERYFDFVYDGAIRMQNMISDVLEYSRVASASQPSEQVSLNEIIDQLIENFQSMHDNISITREDLPDLQGHRTRFVQLFQNLIGNGLKYQKKDVMPCVSIKLIEDEEKWTFIVEDNGIGIAEENLTKVFDIFTRLHRRDEYTGSGIGLSICKKVVDSYGGKIWVESEYGQGARFCFTILK